MVEADYTGVVLDGRYRIRARLGQGGMGTVYVAEHVGLGQPRAIKFLRADLARKPGTVQRFLQEARVLSAMRHDNLVGVIDMGEHAGSAYYVMELLTGEDLRRRLRRLGGLAWPQTRAIALQVCAALRLTHARGVVHRDLKPENCFCLDAEAGAVHVKLLDFGVAKVPREAGGASQLTGAGELLGTIGYMAPEQLEGQSDRRVDVYSLGAMMFEMLAGRPLHTGNAYEILARTLLAPAPALSGVCVVDPAIDRLIATAVARDPDDRFASMDAFAAAIAEIPATAEPQVFIRPAAPAQPEGETTAGGTPVPGDMPVTAAPGPEDLQSSSPHRPARAPADSSPADPLARTDLHVLALPVPEDISPAALISAPSDGSPAPNDAPVSPSSSSADRAPNSPVPADISPAPRTPSSPVPTDSSPAPSKSRVAPGLAVALLTALIAWQVWPADEASTPPTPPPAPAATAPAPADISFTTPPAPSNIPDPPETPVPAATPSDTPAPSPDPSPIEPAPSASPTPPQNPPVPATSPTSRPTKPSRDATKLPLARPLTRDALRARLARELARCGSPYVAEEIAIRVTPGEAGRLANLAAIADDRLASGTVDCLERELARVLAGLTDGVDAARAFDISLTLPRRGGG